MTISELRRYLGQSDFSSITIHFAEFIGGFSDEVDPILFLTAGLVLHRVQSGDVCLNLADYAGKPIPADDETPDGFGTFPGHLEWLESLKASRMVGLPGDKKPLILDETGGIARVYLLRYWQYERRIIEMLLERHHHSVIPVEGQLLQSGLDRLFKSEGPETDWQRQAAESALKNRFTVITGGPGTGKTSTVIKIMILLLEQSGTQAQRIALAAPTGKAAARLKESVIEWKHSILEWKVTDPAVLERVPDETATIHRLLGNIRFSPYFRYNRDNRLPYDTVIIDEASMIDIALMSKLIEALDSKTRLILLGDKHQLSSVEAGSVFGDICDGLAGGNDSDSEKRPSNVVTLRKSYRFAEDRGIGRLSLLINRGMGGQSLDLLSSDTSTEIGWQKLPEKRAVKEVLKTGALQNFQELISATTPEKAFEQFVRFSILCAVRRGPYGVVSMNRLIEQLLVESRQIAREPAWYSGRPIMITRNNYDLQLFNGDIGICLKDPTDHDELKVFFEKRSGEFKKISLFRLPDHEPVYAMTIHKSQGSEFDHVVLVLPDTPSPLLSRELLYTGITRAKNRVEIWANQAVFLKSVEQRIARSSGLKSGLLEPV